jgi:U3 small nucleolar RNA-associated protein 4
MQLESITGMSLTFIMICLFFKGVDPLIISFAKVWLRGGAGTGSNGRSKWVKSVQRRIHDHDVRALVLADGKLLSAG